MHEPYEHDDDVTNTNVVRSQFGTPASSGNGPIPRRRARHAASSDEGRRGASKARRRRYTENDDDSASEDFPQWTVSRPSPRKRHAEIEEPPKRRMTRAERRRAAAATEEAQPQPSTQEPKSDAESASELDFSATKSADLSRIADFLRSTQNAAAEPDTAEPDPPPTAGRHASPPQSQVVTSELPTVEVETPAKPHSLPPSPDESILDVVRRVPGVTDAHLTNSDSKLALDIAETADTDEVHRQVLEVLEANLGMQAQPVSPAAPTLEGESINHPGPIPNMGRTVLERIQVFTSGFESTVEVGLEVNGMRAVGRATSPAVDWHIMRGAADATVDAIGVLIGRHARVVTEHAAIEKAGSLRVAVVVVLLLSEAGAEQLAGAAPVTGDHRQAVVHATLQALNRRLEAMLLA